MPIVSEEAFDERPEMTDAERQQLEELQAKSADVTRAEAEEAAEEARLEKERRNQELEDRPLNYILVRHMGRSPRTRTLRAARAGNRRQGVVLGNGKRIRKKGRRRYTQLDLRDLVDNHTRLLEYVRTGALEFCDPRSQTPIPYHGMLELVEMFGERFAEMDNDVAVDKYEADMEAWGEAHDAWRDLAKAAKKAKTTPPPEPEEPGKPQEVEFVLDASGLEVIGGAEHGFNTAPVPTGLLDDDGQEIDDDLDDDDLDDDEDDSDEDDGSDTEDSGGDSNAEDGGGDDASEGGDDGAGDASGEDAVSAEGEEGTPAEGETADAPVETDAPTEEQLLDMRLDDLKTLAITDYECDDEAVSKMRSKKEVVTAIFANSAEGEE